MFRVGSRFRWPRRWRPFSVALLVAGCGGGSDGGSGPPPGFSLKSVSPPGGASGVPTSTTISATFSDPPDPATVNALSFAITPTAPGTIGVGGSTAGLTPNQALTGGTTYTVALSTAIADAAGSHLSSGYSWSFTTAGQPPPPFQYPTTAGKYWVYADTSSGTVCSGSGCSSSSFKGILMVRSDGLLTWQGRQALRLRRYRLPGSAGTFEVTAPVYLSQGAGGLEVWDNNAWATVISPSRAPVTGGAFAFVDGPNYSAPITYSSSAVTVPAGSFTAVLAAYDYSDTGPYNTKDIFETRSERYADGVGLVTGFLSLSVDDNDPQGVDVGARGTLTLLSVDAGSPVAVLAEVEPNDSAAAFAQAISTPAIIGGDVAITDPGAVLTTTSVQPDSLGVRRIEDWYAFTAPATGTVTIDLLANNYLADLDLYALQVTIRGLSVVGSSVQQAGHDEKIVLPVTAGATYFIGIQAWNKPVVDRTGYTLYVH